MNKRNVIAWAGLFVASLIVLLPLLKSGFYTSDDGEWMVIRLSAFYQSLAEGQFPVRFLGRLNNSYGYPVANFLYPGFLYIGSFLHLIGFSFVDSIKIILAGSVVGSALFLFAWLKRQMSIFASFIGSLSFLLAPYLTFDLYTRGSVGEILAFLPASMALFSLEARNRWLFPFAIGFLIVSHNSLALLFLLLIVSYILFFRKAEFIWPLILGLGLASFFWMPAIFERRLVLFDTVAVSDPFQYLVGGKFLYLAGSAFVLGFLILLFSKRKGFKAMYFLSVFFVSLILTFPFTSSVWTLKPFVQLFQFPYRMLSVGVLVGPWIIAKTVELHKKRGLMLAGAYSILGIIPLFLSISRVRYIERQEGYYTTNEATTTVANEYMPRWVEDVPTQRSPNRIELHSGAATVLLTYITSQRLVAQIDAREKSVLQINSIYYPGWGVTVDGQRVPIDYQNNQGLMRVSVSTGQHILRTEFRETVPRFLADLASLVSFSLYILYVVRRKRKNA